MTSSLDHAQEREFQGLWFDFWQLQGAPGVALFNTRTKSRRWREGIALFASTLRLYELALQRAQLEHWQKRGPI